MKAIRIHQHGDLNQLVIDELPTPTPKANEVLINIKASAMNHLDVWIRNGLPNLTLPLPLIPGSDGCGEIISIGNQVQKFKVGDKVFVNPGFGCGDCTACKAGSDSLCEKYFILGEHVSGLHCSHICLPETQVEHLPANLNFEQGAAFPLVFLTSWHMAVVKGKIEKDQSILIMAAGSGIGSAGVQIARAKGARIIATVGKDDQKKIVEDLGADVVINHYTDDIAKKVKEFTNGKGVDVVFEHVGQKVWQACLRSLKKGGRLVTCGATTGPKIEMDLRHLFIKHHQILGSTMGDSKDFRDIVPLIASEKLKPIIHEVLPYTEIKRAHQIIEKGGIMGKVVLKWD